ncbi:MAG TPA: 2-phospho-L-lactate transferase CofD family protein [Solirubrobacteraceae bacterium]|nr:2-phospho-L-lactate transferase CofD family protein [Solirubrobacteraceae bacterium]
MVVLAGGTGGAKLARGMLDVVGPDELVVIANTGDDIEIYGAYVSPDPDLLTFWLADRIDERGWGIAGDTFKAMEGFKAIGVDVWFNLGDQDLAIGLERARRLQQGDRLTAAQAAIARALNVPGTVLPMCDEPVRTRVLTQDRWWPFQEYMIRAGGARAEAGPVQDVDFRGARAARPTPEVLTAIARASAIVIGPSNPIISIGPMLAVTGMKEALTQADAPTVAVSPLVAGEVVKGPTAAFMDFKNVPITSDGIATYYVGLIHGLVADERTEHLPVLETDVLMATPADRRRLAEQTLNFALALG